MIVLSKENRSLELNLNEARLHFNMAEDALLLEMQHWKQKHTLEQEKNKELRATIEDLQGQVADAAKDKRENHVELESTRGELFDVRHELRQMMLQVELGQQCRDELTRLQSEVLMMGEIQLKCREKFTTIEQLEDKDAKIERLKESYTDELNNLRTTLEHKSGQVEAARVRCIELESALSRRDTIFTDLKRDLRKTKEEYQERIEALEKKYTAQKSLVLRMEEHILELYKSKSTAAHLVPLSPDSTEAIGSLEHPSPLSLSQTSSDGLSPSLKSITEIRNLQAIALGDLQDVKKSSPADIPGPSRSTSN